MSHALARATSSPLQTQRDVGAGPVGSEASPALVPEPAVRHVAHGAPGPGAGEGAEDPVHVPEGLCYVPVHFRVDCCVLGHVKKRSVE